MSFGMAGGAGFVGIGVEKNIQKTGASLRRGKRRELVIQLG